MEVINFFSFSVYLMPSVRGTHPLLMFNGYTYKKQRVNLTGRVAWYCSNRYVGCKAYVESIGEVYTPGSIEHNHPKPKYCQTKNGKWVKL